MWIMLLLVLLQTLFLAGGQVFLKLAMVKMPSFSFTAEYFKILLTNWWFLACGISFGVATVLWLYILKHYPFSQAYPLTAIGYIFGMVAALLVFGEQIPVARWIGVVLIVLGCALIMR